MYLSYYKLQTNPFKISSDPRFLWMGEKHKEALATLTYGLKDNKGFLLLTGDVGSGKTTLINALLNSLDDNVLVGVISDPGLSTIDFFNYISHIFNFKKKFKSKGDFLVHFSMFLNGVHITNKKVLLIIDEAQRLPDELLEEVRLLSNIERQDTKLINIFFVGQNEFNKKLLNESNRALRQRIALNYNIEPLDEAETLLYIKHRLLVAGGKFMMFNSEAVSEIYKYSGGYPRQINIICDLALLSGYVNEKKIIGNEIITECVKELNIPQKIEKEASNEDVEKKSSIQMAKYDTTASETSTDYKANKDAKKKGRFFYFSAIFIIIALLLSYLLLFHPLKLSDFIGEAHKSLNSIYSTAFEMVTGNTPELIQNSIVANVKIDHNVEDKNQTTQVEQESSTLDEKIEEKNQTAQVEQESSTLDGNIEEKNDTTQVKQKSSTLYGNIEEKNDTTQVKQKSSMLDGNIEEKNDTTQVKQESSTLDEKIEETTPIIEQNPVIEQQSSEETEIDLSYLNKKVTINFEYNSNDLSEENRQELKKMAQLLQNDKNRKVKIVGHSDSAGNPSYNKQLSIFRANIVKSFMSGCGAEPEQLILEGKGGGEPVADNSSAQGRQMNRRVELEFILP